MSDPIGRQAAIDAVIDEFKRSPTPAIRARFRLEALPSAQPEIIRCKDCKRYDAHKHRCKWWNHGVSNIDWCSYAERRADE